MPILTLCITIVTFCFLLVTAYHVDAARAEKKFWGRFGDKLLDVLDVLKKTPELYADAYKHVIAEAEASAASNQGASCAGFGLSSAPDPAHSSDAKPKSESVSPVPEPKKTARSRRTESDSSEAVS